jgi:uncharacterized protein YjiS (DUF1127 family)
MTALFAKAPGAFSLVGVLRTQFAALKAAKAERDEYTRVFDELSAMSDRDLADIGVYRGMIEDIAKAAADK